MHLMFPKNFPGHGNISALTGAQRMLAMVEAGGKSYRPGNTPAETKADCLICEAMA